MECHSHPLLHSRCCSGSGIIGASRGSVNHHARCIQLLCCTTSRHHAHEQVGYACSKRPAGSTHRLGFYKGISAYHSVLCKNNDRVVEEPHIRVALVEDARCSAFQIGEHGLRVKDGLAKNSDSCRDEWSHVASRRSIGCKACFGESIASPSWPRGPTREGSHYPHGLT
jgi:hypothetical protein